MNRELKIFLGLVAVFLGLYYLPIDSSRFQGAILEAFKLSKWYAREHVLLCLVPAFFIAGEKPYPAMAPARVPATP